VNVAPRPGPALSTQSEPPCLSVSFARRLGKTQCDPNVIRVDDLGISHFQDLKNFWQYFTSLNIMPNPSVIAASQASEIIALYERANAGPID
jgi:hypothetical protein